MDFLAASLAWHKPSGEHSAAEHTWNFPDLNSGTSSDAPDSLLCNKNGLKGSKPCLLFMFMHPTSKSLTESAHPHRSSMGKLSAFTGIFPSCK